MREYIDVGVLLNLVSMLRADIDGAVWLVDDDEEARFYLRCVHEKGRVVPAPNSAVRVLDLAQDRGIEGVVATVCGDEDAAGSNRPDVFRVSVGDVVSLLLISRGSDEVLVDICGREWLKACTKEVGPVLHRAIWIACFFASLGRLCGSEGALVFDVGSVSSLIQWDAFEPAWDRLSGLLGEIGLPGTILEEARGNCGESPVRNILACDGMYAVHVLAAATRSYRPRGIRALRGVQAQDLVAMLRMAFDLHDFEADEIFWQMRRWERRNPRYPLLRAWRVLDPLGVVLDQRYWEDDLEHMLRLLGPSEPLAAFKMDLDNFKSVNELLGHQVGDDAICLYCATVQEVLRDSAEVYRRGGDEVVALAPGLHGEAAGRLAEKVRCTIERTFAEWGKPRGLSTFPTCSIGLALTCQGATVEETVRLMDGAQRQAKELGKNRVVVLAGGGAVC
jgi:diguanylate cyclase (GGDEF)-like protein